VLRGGGAGGPMPKGLLLFGCYRDPTPTLAVEKRVPKFPPKVSPTPADPSISSFLILLLILSSFFFLSFLSSFLSL